MAQNPRSVVLVDWSRHVEPTAPSRDQLFFELMILSLLYDEVLIPDEILVCSKKLASWFKDPDDFKLLEELLDVGSIVILKRPVEKYPSEELRDLAADKPIQARGKHLQTYSVLNDGTPITFTREQLVFQGRLEACLLAHNGSHRHAGFKRGLSEDLMLSFGRQLSEVLSDDRYRKWRQTKFPGITQEIAQDFVKFVHQPVAAIDLVKSKGLNPKFTPIQGQPIFNTALAEQVAATYPQDHRRGMADLIETVFALPFCQDEGADGRYGPALRELPYLNDEEQETAIGPAVKVETRVTIPVGLPTPRPGFAGIIHKVRKGSGRNLRDSMARLGKDPSRDLSFLDQEQAWREVADEVASNIVHQTNEHKFQVHSIGASIGQGLFYGAVFDLAANPPSSFEQVLPTLGLGLIGEGFSVAGDYLETLVRMDLQHQKISAQLEQAAKFRCVQHPILKKKTNPRSESKENK